MEKNGKITKSYVKEINVINGFTLLVTIGSMLTLEKGYASVFLIAPFALLCNLLGWSFFLIKYSKSNYIACMVRMIVYVLLMSCELMGAINSFFSGMG